MRAAWSAVAVGAGLLAAAATFDAEPLYVGGVAFALAGLLAIAWVLVGTLGVVVERELGTHTAVEDQPVDVRVRIRSGLTPLLTGVVEDELLPDGLPLAFGRRAMAMRVRATFARRGPRVLSPVRVTVRDPLGLARRTRVAGTPIELLVLPRLHPVTFPGGVGGGGEGILGARAGRPRMAAEVELDGLRPHRPGSPASRIHWSVFARTDELWERMLLADADARPLVVLDPRTNPDDEGEAGLDAAVRAAASLAVTLARESGCALLLPGDRRPIGLEPGLTGWPRAHVRLALVIAGGSPSLAGVAGHAGPVVYVAARAQPRPPRVLQGATGGVRILVVPGAPAGRRVLFSVAGCTGYALTAVRAEAA
jgi:uncharacterized protein (DUF58 family)